MKFTQTIIEYKNKNKFLQTMLDYYDMGTGHNNPICLVYVLLTSWTILIIPYIVQNNRGELVNKSFAILTIINVVIYMIISIPLIIQIDKLIEKIAHKTGIEVEHTIDIELFDNYLKITDSAGDIQEIQFENIECISDGGYHYSCGIPYGFIELKAGKDIKIPAIDSNGNYILDIISKKTNSHLEYYMV